MAKTELNPKVDAFLNKPSKWQAEFTALRKIAIEFGLTEEFKWGKPCYALNGSNVFLIHGFKEYCALLFMKGALLGDPENILIQQTENVQAARQIRFTNLQQIIDMELVLKSYIQNAIDVETAGLKVEMKRDKEFPIPEELQTRFDELPAFKEAFEALTPGRQRAYLLYFGSPKQSKTRVSRIEKYQEQIFDGLGLND
ncbi:YdeI/OmpD-associated family protein [Listeria seeligeri]|uniref:YdeI/OmpD-associated family protein n=1 Tax=Listeria seeligeri TaxID=1640 RepID=UPI0018898850|nr:YdeI family protein [Listeria seeligeri]MBF2475403.1 YdeI/OmpD-associated family protein [Listeria seeligeri]MBF2662611.1 YdeI/OmpD-associated family protein [Listeria seeligeri]